MSFTEFLARAAFATYVTVLFGGFAAVILMLVREMRALREEEMDLNKRHRALDERQRKLEERKANR